MTPMDIAFWIVPTAEQRYKYQAVIDRLARKYGSQPFTPHVTVCTGSITEEILTNVISGGTAGVKKMVLMPQRIETTGKFTKTFFIAFRQSDSFSSLRQMLCKRIDQPPDRFSAPHMSLLYKTMPSAELETLKSREPVELSPVTFDQLRAVHTPPPVATPSDVARWRIIERKNLAHPGEKVILE